MHVGRPRSWEHLRNRLLHDDPRDAVALHPALPAVMRGMMRTSLDVERWTLDVGRSLPLLKNAQRPISGTPRLVRRSFIRALLAVLAMAVQNLHAGTVLTIDGSLH